MSIQATGSSDGINQLKSVENTRSENIHQQEADKVFDIEQPKKVSAVGLRAMFAQIAKNGK